MAFIVVKRKSIFFVLTFCICLLALGLNCFNHVSAAGLFFGNNVRLVPTYEVETAEEKIAISFDAAWGADKTEMILEELVKNNVKATFFLVGFWAEEHKDLVKKIDEAGMEIGLHSNSHPDFCKLSKEQMENEILTCKKIVEEITGKTHNLFRFPFGSYNDTAMKVCIENKIVPIQWSIDTLDWKGIGAKEIVSRVLSKAGSGKIVLMHNNSDNVEKALPVLIDRLKKKNLQVTSVGDLIYKENYQVNRFGIMKKC